MASLTNGTAANNGSSPTKIEITPELVREVADKVYAQMRRDLRHERERYPRRVSPFTTARRGW